MGLRVLELYCGIGGMHHALENVGRSYEVVGAMDINSTVLETYGFNFPETKWSNRNIISITAKDLNDLGIDMIVLSPPCQPFCRSGLQLDTQDARTDSFCHLMNILPQVIFKYILLENVKGFEISDTHSLFLNCLRKCSFKWQEFLLTPTSVGIPNSRLRYYLIGKLNDLSWSFQYSENIMTQVPKWDDTIPEETSYGNIVRTEESLWQERRRKLLDQVTEDKRKLPSSRCVGDIMEKYSSDIDTSSYNLSFSILKKYYPAMDIVNIYSTSSCCFTKSYGTYVKGSGSILNESSMPESEGKDTSNSEQLRFFTPREIARLMSYPESFQFSPNATLKQQYRALGNSLNVYVVSILLELLVSSN